MEETPPPPKPSTSTQEGGNEVSSSLSSSLSSLMEVNSSPSPMENNVIVRLLLEYCINDLESLQTFALVSRVWYDATRPRWNALVGTLRLYPTEEQRIQKNEEVGRLHERIMNIEEFCRKASKKDNILQKYPYHKYELRYWDLQPNHFGVVNALNAAQPLSAAQSWFWASNRLKYITHLNMHHCKAHGGTFTMYSEEFLKVFPSLKFLKIIGADISEEAVNEILHRFSNKSDYYEHPTLEKVHLEPLLPLATAYRALGVFNRSMTSMKSLYVRELRGDDPDQDYKIADFTPGHFHDLHQLVRDRAFDTLDVVEYTSNNPEHRAFKNYPVQSRDGISSFQGTFEVFSGSIQKEIVLSGGNGEDTDGESDNSGVMFKLDMYACPFSTHPETHVCWDGRLNKISLWGGFACSLGFLRGMGKLEELTYNTSCFGNEVHRRKVLKFLKEDGEGTFQDKNPFGGGNQLEIKGDTISLWARKCQGFPTGFYPRLPFVTTSPPRPLNRSFFNQGPRSPWVYEPANIHGTQFTINHVNGTITITPCEPDKDQAIVRNLKKLDIDFRFGDERSWRSLGEAFPNVQDLKGVIQSDNQLMMIRNTWPGLTGLVVGHGSSQLSLEVILEVVGGLADLRKFEWKGCACLGLLANPRGKLTRKQRKLEEQLEGMGVEFTLPWGRKEEGEMERICLEKVFDEAMKSGRISKKNLELLLSL